MTTRHSRRGGGFLKSLFAEPKPPRLPRAIAKQWMDLRVQAFLLERQLQEAGQDRDDAQESPTWQAWADLDMALQGKWDPRARSRAMDRAYKIASKKRLSKKKLASKSKTRSGDEKHITRLVEALQEIAMGRNERDPMNVASRALADLPSNLYDRWVR